MNCSVCGCQVHKGERFCPACGTALTPPSPDGKARADNRRYAPPAEEPYYNSAPAEDSWEAEPNPQKRDRGLNIALLVCAVLAIAVVTFVAILLLSSGNKQNQPTATYPPAPVQPVVTPGASAVPGTLPTATPQPGGNTVVVTVPPSSTTLPVVTSAPTAAPVVTPVPTIAPTPTPTPTPTPAPDYLLPDSNTRYLSEADLSGLTHEQLCFARNEIFARHGRIFQTPEIAAYFNSKSWYRGTVSADNFKDSVFNDYERYNIQLISEYEKKYYGGSYY